MARGRLPLLRGKITSVDTFVSPQQWPRPALPSCQPQEHRSRLLAQLNDVVKQVNERPAGARDALAERETVAIFPAKGTRIAGDDLGSARADAQVVGQIPETGVVLLDVKDVALGHLREKLDAFADDARVRTIEKDGKTIIHRAAEVAVAPIGGIALATLADIAGANLRARPLERDRAYWFEIGCRGGYRLPKITSASSRKQIIQQSLNLGVEHKIDEFEGPGLIYFFVRMTLPQLTALHAATDCIFEVELAPEPIRDMKLFECLRTKELKTVPVAPPADDAPAVVVLDTGLASAHPLLKDACLPSTTCGPEIPSPEDTWGHGTKMAGVALHRELGRGIEDGRLVASHWIQSSRLLVRPGVGLAADSELENWPNRTRDAVKSAEAADPKPRKRVFALAVTRSMQDDEYGKPGPTLWSHAVDQLAYQGGGRLLLVSAGNAREEQWSTLAEQYPRKQLSEKIHQPAQAANALTVGACTSRVSLPPDKSHQELRLVATVPGGISPFTSSGISGGDWPTKPDVVLEGGNLAFHGNLPNSDVPTLSALTTGHRHHLGNPLGLLSMTSEATARAANLAARIWRIEPRLRPETVRGLIVHSACWTPAMEEQFPALDDRLSACGYGIPEESVACECAQERATIIIEDSMPNAVVEEVPKRTPPKRETTKTTEPKALRKVKIYRLPIPNELLVDSDPEVELRVTLSYFGEPSKSWNRVTFGLDLKWDMQGPRESEQAFLQRINADMRPKGPDGRRLKYKQKTNSFSWTVGSQRRARGTVQSDRWTGRMSALAGDKLIAVEPVLGWWSRSQAMRTEEMRFSLIVSVFGPGVYAAIKPRVEVAAGIPVEV